VYSTGVLPLQAAVGATTSCHEVAWNVKCLLLLVDSCTACSLLLHSICAR